MEILCRNAALHKKTAIPKVKYRFYIYTKTTQNEN